MSKIAKRLTQLTAVQTREYEFPTANYNSQVFNARQVAGRGNPRLMAGMIVCRGDLIPAKKRLARSTPKCLRCKPPRSAS